MSLPGTGERFMPRYGGRRDQAVHRRRYFMAGQLVRGQVIDIGCGDGYGTTLLAASASRVVGVEISPEAVTFGRERFASPKVRYTAGDARALPFEDASFDWAVSFEFSEHIEDNAPVMAELARVLNGDGRLLISRPIRAHEADIAEFRALLSRYFEDVVLIEQDRLVAGRVVCIVALCGRRRVVQEREAERNEVRAGYESVIADLKQRLGDTEHSNNAVKAELQAIHTSRMWRTLMMYYRARNLLGWPWRYARRATHALAARKRQLIDLPARMLTMPFGWSYLAAWTAGAWIGARRSVPHANDPARVPRRRPRVLIVCPYPIYPPDHGGGVRIYNLLRRLSRDCDLHLLIFIRADDDALQRAALEPLVKKLYFHHWQPALRQDLWGLTPKSAQLFASPEVQSRINEILSRERIDILQLEFTELGQYGLPRYARVKVVLSEIDITFRSRYRRRRAGLNRRYDANRVFGHTRTDLMRLFRYELRVAARADQVHVMSHADGSYLARFLPNGGKTIRVVPNAVDIDAFKRSETPRAERQLLFIGNFQHLPNQDALDYLMTEIWPRIRARVPDAELIVVGAKAGELVYRYDGRDGVTVVGEVADPISYYQRCTAMVAPIRAGSGTRLKILEALACATPVVTTTIGAEGIEGIDGEHLLIRDSAADLATAVATLLSDAEQCARIGMAGRALVERLYGWERSAAAVLDGYAALLDDMPEESGPQTEASSGEVDVSIVIPTLNGGAVLEQSLASIRRQRTKQSYEIICVDSGSASSDLAAMERYGARVVPIHRGEFNHGLTRDLGASQSKGRVVVFINQDAVPSDERWLENLMEPFAADHGCAAVQGAIDEFPEGKERFYWDSCGRRFYFTRESRRWIERYFGIGFSTVNAAIRRDVWTRHPFGYAQIMEDKKWQREIVESGYGIAYAPRALVYHTHNYKLRSLLRRCESEGFGWRTMGERYSVFDMLADLVQPRMYADLLRGLARRQIRSGAELLFPWLRPIMVFLGNRWSREPRL